MRLARASALALEIAVVKRVQDSLSRISGAIGSPSGAERRARARGDSARPDSRRAAASPIRRREEALGGAARQGARPAVVDGAELLVVAVRLLEVVAEDLLELGRPASPATSLEPVGEALVQLGPQLLRRARVGGVADEDVAEAEGGLADEVCAGRADELPVPRSRSRASATRARSPSAESATTAAAVEDLALDRSRARAPPVRARGRRSRRAASSALRRRRQHVRTAVSSRHERGQLLEEERVPARSLERRARAARARASAAARSSSASAACAAERLAARSRTRQSACALERARAGRGRAAEHRRVVAARVRQAGEQLEQRLLRPLEIVDDTSRQAGVARAPPSSRRIAQAISSADDAPAVERRSPARRARDRRAVLLPGEQRRDPRPRLAPRVCSSMDRRPPGGRSPRSARR